MTTPLPRWYLLLSKLGAGIAVSLVQVYAFYIIAILVGVDLPWQGLAWITPALILSGLMLGALGLLLSSVIKQLENFAGIMNFVIFPLFFLSTALYPIWKMRESSVALAAICEWNPFSHAVELIRFAIYGQFNGLSFLVTLVSAAVFFAVATIAYDPASKFRARGMRGG